jgi:hypothetical protein
MLPRVMPQPRTMRRTPSRLAIRAQTQVYTGTRVVGSHRPERKEKAPERAAGLDRKAPAQAPRPREFTGTRERTTRRPGLASGKCLLPLRHVVFTRSARIPQRRLIGLPLLITHVRSHRKRYPLGHGLLKNGKVGRRKIRISEAADCDAHVVRREVEFPVNG